MTPLPLLHVDPSHPVATLRYGYPGTGFVFYLVRCLSRKDFHGYVTRRGLDPKLVERDVPEAGMCYAIYEHTLPGLLPEAHDGGSLCSVYILTLQSDDPRMELRHWRHEIGHAAAFVTRAVSLYQFSYPEGWLETAEREAPALVTELLCEAVDLGLSPSHEPPASGLPLLFTDEWRTI